MLNIFVDFIISCIKSIQTYNKIEDFMLYCKNIKSKRFKSEE